MLKIGKGRGAGILKGGITVCELSAKLAELARCCGRRSLELKREFRVRQKVTSRADLGDKSTKCKIFTPPQYADGRV
ncbi:hypothetical protein GCM10025772_08750 [Ferrimonas gelatinilytica]|uniref:Uncharacterized protein n=1 Tax=Ferrimonas gelatinilytica TaxID=1255257 RepID=A0ABP9RY27_9GAMM